MSNLNVKNRTIFCHDNLEILQGINSNSIDLIYLDPPFNKKKTFMAPIGSSAEGAFFEDLLQLEDIKTEWLTSIKQDNPALHDFLNGIRTMDGRKSYNFCYLAYMAIRLIEMHRILKDTGSIYLHCDPLMSHYLKLVMDCIFSEKRFINEILWCYKTGGTSKKWFSKKHDVILFYSKTRNYFFNSMKGKSYQKANFKGQEKEWWLGHGYTTFKKDEFGRVYSLTNLKDYWTDISYIQSQAKERTGYPTQKPLALLERIIKASCPENGVVLDPFCGCATAPVASEILNRKWIGIDVSVKAFELVKIRLERQFNQGNIFEQPWKGNMHFLTNPPERTDTNGNCGPKKWVYVISNPNHKTKYPYKVGVASNWKSRLNSYQTGDPARAYQIDFKLNCYNFNEVEEAIHNKFENEHEWVVGELKNIITEIKKLAEI